MSSINISDLRPAGYDLLLDNDNYLEDLNENEIERVVGGTAPLVAAAVVVGAGAVGAAVGYALDALID